VIDNLAVNCIFCAVSKRVVNPMSNRFEAFAVSGTGIALADAINTTERFFEFRTLSENGKPAVQAIARDVVPIIEKLPTKKERDSASQFCGWYVGQIMRAAGYEIIQKRGRVGDAPFQTGAVWKQIDRGVQLVTAPPQVSMPGRLELEIKQGDCGSVVAEWTVTMTATSRVTGAVRRKHLIMSPARPVDEACQEALGYAKRLGIQFVWVNDPSGLFPKENWPV
jgi:hypothetical protein